LPGPGKSAVKQHTSQKQPENSEVWIEHSRKFSHASSSATTTSAGFGN
jgi:hypothetical protein